jgi:hypothetical protein
MSDPIRSLPAVNPVMAAVLAFESRRWNHRGAKDQAIHDLFGVSSHRYYQSLRHLIEDPEALIFDPTLVNRLRRLRDAASRRRAA